MADMSTSEANRRALAVRLRELRTGGLETGPLNRKELGRLLGEAMNRPAGAYAARRVGDFENAQAKSPPPADALRAYARIFTAREPGSETGNGAGEPASSLEKELLALRDGIDAPPAPAPRADSSARPARRWMLVVGAVGLLVVAMAAISVARPDPPPKPVFCARNTETRPSPGAVAVVCARDVMLRPSPSAPADQAIGVVESGDRFTVDRYSPTGAWVHGTAHLENGTESEGWIEGGWFCPPAGDSPATACAAAAKR